ncbi:TPA: HIT family protein [Candidatus Woesearchaeota archaeon]|nr:HIT family protein [Candidatus Woesearchaeota archaeon]
MECIFCDFALKKRKKHQNGLPFLILHETKHSVSFLSTDMPATEEGHTLVIPKKHYEKLENVPAVILHDLIGHVQLISKALLIKNSASNILLNNGRAAGQRVFHLHFHVIPRNENDKINIEVWKEKKITKDDFKLQSRDLQKKIQKMI